MAMRLLTVIRLVAALVVLGGVINAAAAPTQLKCDSGPVPKTLGATEWLVYSCDDGDAVLISAAPGNPAMPFFFSFRRKGTGYRLTGQGAGGRETAAAALEELQRYSTADIEALVAQTKASIIPSAAAATYATSRDEMERAALNDEYGLVFYTEPQFTGTRIIHHCIAECNYDPAHGMHFSARSIKVTKGRWILCSETRLRGGCIELPQGEYPTTESLFPSQLQERIRSVKRISVETGDAVPIVINR